MGLNITQSLLIKISIIAFSVGVFLFILSFATISWATGEGVFGGLEAGGTVLKANTQLHVPTTAVSERG